MKTAPPDIEQEAAGWVVILDDPDCTKAQLAAFDAWLARGVENARAFKELRGVWKGMDGVAVARLAAAAPDEPASPESKQEVLQALDTADPPSAFQGVIRAYHQRYASDTQEVSRLVRETYHRLLVTASGSPASARSVPESLLITAKDLALEQLRQKGILRSEILTDIAALERLDVAQQIEVIASTDRILSTLTLALNALPRRYRKVCILYNLQRRTCAQVAVRLGISQKTVKQRLVRIACHFEAALADC